jgi:hypothetical protein
MAQGQSEDVVVGGAGGMELVGLVGMRHSIGAVDRAVPPVDSVKIVTIR